MFVPSKPFWRGAVASTLTSLSLYRWLWRQRIRLHLEGTGINPTPVDLHEQQLSLEQHNQAHRITTSGIQRGSFLHCLLVLLGSAAKELHQSEPSSGSSS